MKTKKRQKLCYNCEGEVDLDVIVCPFCASDLREEKPEQLPSKSPQTFRNTDTEAALYPPSHAPRIRIDEEPSPPQIQIEEEEEQSKTPYGSIVLLALGAQLLLLGLFMLMFSTNGVFMIKWDARFWYFYILASLPLLVFGFRWLKN